MRFKSIVLTVVSFLMVATPAAADPAPACASGGASVEVFHLPPLQPKTKRRGFRLDDPGSPTDEHAAAVDEIVARAACMTREGEIGLDGLRFTIVAENDKVQARRATRRSLGRRFANLLADHAAAVVRGSIVEAALQSELRARVAEDPTAWGLPAPASAGELDGLLRVIFRTDQAAMDRLPAASAEIPGVTPGDSGRRFAVVVEATERRGEDRQDGDAAPPLGPPQARACDLGDVRTQLAGIAASIEKIRSPSLPVARPRRFALAARAILLRALDTEHVGADFEVRWAFLHRGRPRDGWGADLGARLGFLGTSRDYRVASDLSAPLLIRGQVLAGLYKRWPSLAVSAHVAPGAFLPANGALLDLEAGVDKPLSDGIDLVVRGSFGGLITAQGNRPPTWSAALGITWEL